MNEAQRRADLTELTQREKIARDSAFKQGIGFSPREGLIHDEAWDAARKFYIAYMKGEHGT